ncbi:MAG: hypothetical protein IKP95_13355 [Ruminococcus sp.]|nr:hypothetical protein [Ruminococcus sp.]
MNEKGFGALSLLSEIDGRFIAEAQEDCITVRRRRVFKTPFIAAAIIILLTLSTVGTVAYVKGYLGHKENVEHQYFYNEALIPELEKRAMEPLVFENEHLRITIDAIISDAVCVEASATIEGLDAQGKEFVENGVTLENEVEGLTDSEVFEIFGGKRSFIPFMTAPGRDGRTVRANSSADGMYGKKGEHSEAAFTIMFPRDRFPDCETLELTCMEPSLKGTDDWEPGIFKGMILKIPMRRNFDTLVLSSDPGKEVYLSEVCFYQTKPDIWGGDDFDLTVYYKDGTEQNITKDRKGITVGEYLFRIDDVEHIEFCGIRYYPKEIIPAAQY